MDLVGSSWIYCGNCTGKTIKFSGGSEQLFLANFRPFGWNKALLTWLFWANQPFPWSSTYSRHCIYFPNLPVQDATLFFHTIQWIWREGFSSACWTDNVCSIISLSAPKHLVFAVLYCKNSLGGQYKFQARVLSSLPESRCGAWTM